MTDDAARLETVFAYIDEHGGPVVTARAELGLGNGQSMTISAGGGTITSAPPAAPYTHYEVVLDHEPARFWRRFSDDDRLLYANVPRLLVAHHALRHGGVVWAETSTEFVHPSQRKPRIAFPIKTVDELASVLSTLTGTHVDANVLRWQ